VEALRLADDVTGLLHQLGIYAVGQLETLPREELTSRFGPQLLERWDQATGRRPEPVRAQPPPPELRVTHSLEHPTTRRRTIELVVEPLIAQLARMLVREGRGAVQLDCRLDCPSASGIHLSVGLFQPSASARHLFELVRMQLERVWLGGPVSAVSLEAALTAPFERRQGELFADGRSPRRSRQLAGLVDRLTGRLGRRSVLRARLVRDAQPELACQYEPLVQGSRSGKARRVLGGRGLGEHTLGGRGRAKRAPGTLDPGGPLRGTPATLPPRPLRLLPRPVPLAAVSIMPDGPPLQFPFHGRPHRIAHTWGPERIETGWWRGRPVRRDYYRVETTTGRRYWLFRDLDDGKWFLHGTFE
jgi:protein ImuB